MGASRIQIPPQFIDRYLLSAERIQPSQRLRFSTLMAVLMTRYDLHDMTRTHKSRLALAYSPESCNLYPFADTVYTGTEINTTPPIRLHFSISPLTPTFDVSLWLPLGVWVARIRAFLTDSV
jgi:hypothetical protein